MPARETVSLKYRADIADLRKELAKVPGITKAEATKMARELEVGLKKAERASRRAAKASRKEWQRFGSDLKHAGLMAAGAVTGIVALGQELADLQNQLSDASVRSGVATDTLAGLRLAAEGAGLSFSTLERGLDRLPKAMADAQRGSGSAARAFADLGVEVEDGQGNLRDANAVLEETFAALAAIENPAQRSATAIDLFGQKAGPAFVQSGAVDALDTYVELSREFGFDTGPAAAEAAADFERNMALLKDVGSRELQEVLGSLGGEGGIADLLNVATKGLILFGATAQAVIDGFSERVHDVVDGPVRALSLAMQGEMAAALQVLEDTAGQTLGGVAAIAFTPVSLVRDIIDGVSTGIDELDRFNAKMAEVSRSGGRPDLPSPGGSRGGGAPAAGAGEGTEQIDDRIKALERLSATQRAASEARLSERAKIELAFKREIDLIFAASEAGADANRVAVAADVAQSERMIALAALDERLHEEKLARMEEQAAKAAEVQAKVLSATGDAFGAFTDLTAVAAQRMAEAGSEGSKRAAMLAFGVSKALALAQIPLNVAEGITAALSLPPPADAIKTAAVIATGAAQAASVAGAKPPTFDRGGIINAGTGDQVLASVLPGEAVLNRSATSRLGRQGVDALNSGQGMGGGPIVVEMRYGHRVFDRFVQDNIAAPTPLGNALRGDRVTGRRG